MTGRLMPTHPVIGLMTSSRLPDIHHLIHTHFPTAQLRPLHSTADLQGITAVLAGGGPDLSPGLYGQPDRHCGPTHPARDRRETELLRAVLERELPFLGLCRGAQLLNVTLGGTLHQDLQAERGSAHEPLHPVQWAPSAPSSLRHLSTVNSSHHQGVDTLAPTLSILAWSPDHLPEAWHRPGALGVQFHPETLIHEDPRWLPLFAWWLSGAQ